MIELLVIFVVFAVVMSAMAVGVMFGRKPIAGSCGGLGAVGVERACGCTDVCKNEEKQALRKEAGVRVYYPGKE